MRDGVGGLQRVVLLGGTSDIGLAVVERLVRRRGVTAVALAGRDDERLSQAAQHLVDLGATTSVHALDADGPAARLATQVDEAVGRDADVVVHAIGMLPHDDRAGDDPTLAAEVFDVNTTASGTMLLAAARALTGQGHGTLVAVSSIAAVRARPDNLVYGASKAGYDALALGLADHVRGSGARVLVVRPGYVHSRMTADHPEPPLARWPRDVAAAVDRALDRRDTALARRVVWVPPAMAVVAAGIRALPGTALVELAARLDGGDG